MNRVTISSENRGPILNLVKWVTLCTAILSASIKVYTRWAMRSRTDWSDLFIVLATLTAIAQCIAVEFQVQNGIGQHQVTLSKGQIYNFYVATYITQMFYLLTINSAKLTDLLFFVCLTRPDSKRTVVRCTMSFLAVWLVVSVLVVSFQCRLPQPWIIAPGRCVDQFGFWTVNAVIDILGQVMIASLPVYLLYNLHLTKGKKLLSMLSFSPNLTTIPFIVLRILYIYKATSALNTASDNTMLGFLPDLLTTIHSNFSIIAACIPFSKPIIDSLAIGAITNDIVDPLRPSGHATHGWIDSHQPSGSHVFDGRKRYHGNANGRGSSRNRGRGTVYSGWSGKGVMSNWVSGGRHQSQERGDLELHDSALHRDGSLDRMVIHHTTVIRQTSTSEATNGEGRSETSLW